MNPIVAALQKQARISVIVVSILIGTLLVYLSLFESILIYLVPVEVFFVMHYLKFYRFKPRIIGATVIFFVIVIAAAGIYAQALYTSNGVESQSLANGSNITASVTPFNHQATSYNFSFAIAGNQSIGSYFILVKGINNHYFVNVSENNILKGYNSNHDLILYYHDDNITPSGIYEYYLYFANGTTPVSSIGPLFSSTPVFELYLLDLTPSFMLIFELIFVVGLLIARSISNSAKMRNIPPKVPPAPDQPETIEGDNVQ